MRAIVMTAPGAAEVLQAREIPTPMLRHEHDILVRLKAAGVNPVDTKLRAKGTYYPARMPAVLGCDGAGVVEETGPAVTRFKIGDAVYFCNGGIGAHPGNYAEYAVVDERHTARKPESLDFIQAAAAPLVLITAWESLFDRVQTRIGQRVLIHAGAGGVGHVAIQLARAAGAQVVTTVSNAEKAELVRRLGASNIINYRDADFVESVLNWTNGTGVDTVLDCVGGEAFTRSMSAVRVYGDLVTLLQPPSQMNWQEVRLRNLRISFELMLSPMYYGLHEAQMHHAEILTRCAEMFDSGRLRIHVQTVFPLAEASEAHRMLEQGGITGKVVLQID